MLKKRLLSFKFAYQGIIDLFQSTPNARIHLAVAFFVIAAGVFFDIERYEWLIIIFSITLVIAAESLNTSIEYLTDLVTEDYHLLAKKTKDSAAGGVLICALGAAITGIFVFYPYIKECFFG